MGWVLVAPDSKTWANGTWEPAFTWRILSWQEWFDEMSEDYLLSVPVHEWALTAECLDAKIWEKTFNI